MFYSNNLKPFHDNLLLLTQTVGGSYLYNYQFAFQKCSQVQDNEFFGGLKWLSKSTTALLFSVPFRPQNYRSKNFKSKSWRLQFFLLKKRMKNEKKLRTHRSFCFCFFWNLWDIFFRSFFGRIWKNNCLNFQIIIV